MTTAMAVDLVRQALYTTFTLSMPLLLVGFLAGIIVSLAQIITSMQDASFGALPRLAAFLIGFIVLLPWMMTKLLGYTTTLFSDFGRYTH